MTAPATDRAHRRRAGRHIVGIVLALLVVVAVVARVLLAHYRTTSSPTPATTGPTPTARRPDTASPEDALAARPMLALPVQAAQPQPLSTRPPGPAIALPRPDLLAGRWIPNGFPRTAEGALAQLKALDETTLAAGDPQVYARGYRELSAPGAPDPAVTGLFTLLASLRANAGLSTAGAVNDLSVTYRVTQGQIKGTLTGGAFAVVCVLGQLSAQYRGKLVTAGVGDCQAMRWTGAGWLIAPGTIAAAAPSAWPGSADAAAAGYRVAS